MIIGRRNATLQTRLMNGRRDNLEYLAKAMTRVALIGAGVMGGFHASASREVPDLDIRWVADQDGARAAELAETLGAKSTTDNAEAISSSDVDAVLVATPTPFHRAAVELAAKNGKHVFCEKPIARTVEDAEAMIDACANAGVRLMVGHVVRFFPEYARAKDVLESGVLGQIGVARTSRVGSPPESNRAWFHDFQQSGGLVVDLMIHELDTLRWFFGDVERVYAKGLSYAPRESARDATLAILRFANGVIAHVQASWSHAAFRTQFEIAGENGLLRHDSEASATLRQDRPGWQTESFSPPVSVRGSGGLRPYVAEQQHFCDRLDDGAPFLTPGEDGLRALETALAVLASMRTGQPVSFVDGRPSAGSLEEAGQ